MPIDRLERLRVDYCGVFEFEFGLEFEFEFGGRLPRVRRLNTGPLPDDVGQWSPDQQSQW
jgi:hypothetical protein